MTFPSAIYFDTSCLAQGGEFLNCEAMPEVLGLARDLNVHLHVTQLVLDERLHMLAKDLEEKLRKVRDLALSVEKSVGSPVIERLRDLPDADVLRLVEQRFTNRIRNAGFTVVPNACLDMERLVADAINWIAPFQDKDKGFRDTIIVETVVAHAVAHYNQSAIVVVVRDSRFEEGIRIRGSSAVEIVPALLEDTPQILTQCCEEAWNTLYEQEKETAMALVEENKERIFAHVQRKGVPSSSLDIPNSAFQYTTIKSVKTILPIGFSSVYPKRYFSERSAPGERIRILIGVDVRFELILTRKSSLAWAFGPTIHLDETGLGPVDPAPFPPIDDGIETEETVVHTFNIHATARVVENGQLEDLQLLSDEEVYGNLFANHASE